MIKQFLPQAVCLKCQGCCRFSQQDSIWSAYLLDEEIRDLSCKNIPPAFIAPNKKIRLIAHPRQGGFICAFFNVDDNKCKIYTLRPFECQLYPFLINRKGENIFLAVDLKCPFAAEKLESQEFKAHADYLAGFLNSPRSLDILRNNPQVIQTYPEVLNLRELKF